MYGFHMVTACHIFYHMELILQQNMASQQFHGLLDMLLALEIDIQDSPSFLFVWLDLYFC